VVYLLFARGAGRLSPAKPDHRSPDIVPWVRAVNLRFGHESTAGALRRPKRLILVLRAQVPQVFSRQPVTNMRQQAANSTAFSTSTMTTPAVRSPSAWPMKP